MGDGGVGVNNQKRYSVGPPHDSSTVTNPHIYHENHAALIAWHSIELWGSNDRTASLQRYGGGGGRPTTGQLFSKTVDPLAPAVHENAKICYTHSSMLLRCFSSHGHQRLYSRCHYTATKLKTCNLNLKTIEATSAAKLNSPFYVLLQA
jgi:hypothetical protein